MPRSTLRMFEGKDMHDATYPTTIQASLASQAMIARYDPSGRFIAAGQYAGVTVVWDMETKAIIKVLDGWSRLSRYLLTCSRDWNIILWDLDSTLDPPQRMKTIRFDAPVVSGVFHPRNSKIILSLLSNGEAFLIDTRKGQSYRTELWEKVEEPAPITCLRFHSNGKVIFAGTSLGYILVFNTRTKLMIARHKIPSASTIKSMDFSKSGRYLITNSTDRTIRHFILPNYTYVMEDDDAYLEQELEPIYKYNDPINRVSWNAVGLSHDARWVAGGAADAMGHKIYIWDATSDGRYATTLDGGRETISSLQWHPKINALITTTREGNILLWHIPTQEHFAAFAGGFDEIAENVVYEEREDEFDIEDEDSVARRKQVEEEIDVDVDTRTDSDTDDGGIANEPNDPETVWATEAGDEEVSVWIAPIRAHQLGTHDSEV